MIKNNSIDLLRLLHQILLASRTDSYAMSLVYELANNSLQYHKDTSVDLVQEKLASVAAACVGAHVAAICLMKWTQEPYRLNVSQQAFLESVLNDVELQQNL